MQKGLKHLFFFFSEKSFLLFSQNPFYALKLLDFKLGLKLSNGSFNNVKSLAIFHKTIEANQRIPEEKKEQVSAHVLPVPYNLRNSTREKSYIHMNEMTTATKAQKFVTSNIQIQRSHYFIISPRVTCILKLKSFLVLKLKILKKSMCVLYHNKKLKSFFQRGA